MQRSDWVLLAIAAAEGEAVTPVQLQKSLFLLGRSLPDQVGSDYFTFVPYHYGPFSQAIYRDAEALKNLGLLAIDQIEPGRPWATYRATSVGLERARALSAEGPARPVNHLKAVIQWARGLSFQELVTAIYDRYPEQRANSVFQG